MDIETFDDDVDWDDPELDDAHDDFDVSDSGLRDLERFELDDILEREDVSHDCVFVVISSTTEYDDERWNTSTPIIDSVWDTREAAEARGEEISEANARNEMGSRITIETRTSDSPDSGEIYQNDSTWNVYRLEPTISDDGTAEMTIVVDSIHPTLEDAQERVSELTPFEVGDSFRDAYLEKMETQHPGWVEEQLNDSSDPLDGEVLWLYESLPSSDIVVGDRPGWLSVTDGPTDGFDDDYWDESYYDDDNEYAGLEGRFCVLGEMDGMQTAFITAEPIRTGVEGWSVG